MQKYWWFAPFVIFAAAIPVTGAYPAWNYENICPYNGQKQEAISEILRVDYTTVPSLASNYCANVGRSAYNSIGPDKARNTYLGPIMGVVWANSGDIISPPGQPIQVARYSAFMYVIGPGGVSDHLFLRYGTDVAGR